MSDQTKTALEAAIAAHVADELDGALTTGWALGLVCQHKLMIENAEWTAIGEDD